MRILLLVAIALVIVYALDRQTRRWLRSIGRAAIGGGSTTPISQPRSRRPVRQGRLVTCASCGVRIAESLAQSADDEAFFCSDTCQQHGNIESSDIN